MGSPFTFLSHHIEDFAILIHPFDNLINRF